VLSQTRQNLTDTRLRPALKYEEILEMDMPNLVPMTVPEFDAFLARAIPQYAEGKIKAGNWIESEALENSKKEYAELLPQGLESIDNCLYTLHDGSDAVGLIWMKINRAANKAFICDLHCEEGFRGKGYGKVLMLLLEDEAREMGLKSLGLHVFGYNHVARNLYESIGYEITNVNMSKTL